MPFCLGGSAMLPGGAELRAPKNYKADGAGRAMMGRRAAAATPGRRVRDFHARQVRGAPGVTAGPLPASAGRNYSFRRRLPPLLPFSGAAIASPRHRQIQMRMLDELKRRRVIRVGIVYLVVAWLVIQVAGELIDLLELPTWIGKAIVLVVGLGLPVALALAWAFDVTPDGIRRAEPARVAIPSIPALRSSTSVRRGGWFALGLLVALLAGWAVVIRGGNDAALDMAVVAVAPFRVASADASNEYLREGMIDLLAAKLTGEGGPRAADPRSVLAAWRNAGITEEDDLAPEPSLAAARSLGAGLLIRGDIVGTPTHITINATLLRVSDGREIAPASVEGSPDELPALVDRLAVELLARAGETDPDRIALLAETKLPALRTYLSAQAEFRAGRFDHAMELYREAMTADSTFALNALAWVLAAEWDPEQWPEAIGHAWRLRDRLSARDRIVLGSYAGPSWPQQPTDGEILLATELAVTRVNDRAELWTHLGELLVHSTPRLQYADHRERAQAAFERALAIDSSFLSAYPHLVEAAAFRGDTATMRHLAARYFEGDTTESVARYLMWLVARTTGDEAGVDALIESLPYGARVAYPRVIGMAQIEAIGLEDAERAVEQLRQSRLSPPEMRVVSSYDLNRGRVARAAAADYGPPGLTDVLRVLDALYGDGDSTAAAAAVARLDARARAPLPNEATLLRQQLGAAITAAQWHAWHGDTERIAPTIALLEAEGERAGMPQGSRGIVIALLRAIDAGVRRTPDAARRIAQLEETRMSARGIDPTVMVDGLVPWIAASRLHEMRGDLPAALRAIRQNYYHFFATDHLASRKREEGRLALATGDVEGAIAAWRHYLALRTDPDPALQPEVERVRADLARLVAR